MNPLFVVELSSLKGGEAKSTESAAERTAKAAAIVPPSADHTAAAAVVRYHLEGAQPLHSLDDEDGRIPNNEDLQHDAPKTPKPNPKTLKP